MSQFRLHVQVRSLEDFFDRFERFIGELDEDVEVNLVTAAESFGTVQGKEVVQQEGAYKRYKQFGLKSGVTLLRMLSVSRQNHQVTFALDEFDGYAAPVQLDRNKVSAQWMECLSSCFELATPSQAAALSVPEIANAQLAAHQSAIHALEDTAAKIGRVHAESVTANTDFLNRATEQLSEHHKKLQEEHEAKVIAAQEELAKDRAELESEREDLRLRESRKVRRQLLDDIATTITEQTNFELSRETRRQNNLIRWASMGLICFGGLLVLYALADVSEFPAMAEQAISALAGESAEGNETATAALRSPDTGNPPATTRLNTYVPFVSGAILIGSVSIFWLRHMRLVYSRAEDTDFAIMQFRRDVLRMSWITELVFEAKNNRQEDGLNPIEVPDVLLEQFSKSLFAFTRSSDSPHPIDELQRLSKRFKRVQVGAKGFEVEAKNDGQSG